MKMFVTIFTFKFVTPLNLGAVFLDIFNYAYGPGHPGSTLFWFQHCGSLHVRPLCDVTLLRLGPSCLDLLL